MEIHSDVLDWSTNDVLEWLTFKGFKRYNKTFKDNKIDGKALLLIEENDLKSTFLNIKILGDVKKLNLEIKQLRVSFSKTFIEKGYNKGFYMDEKCPLYHRGNSIQQKPANEYEYIADPCSNCKLISKVVFKPEFLKASIALTYCFIVTWVKAFVMVAVHDRVPVINKYTPLPDLFLDSIPYIPSASKICEWIGAVLLSIWIGVVIFHKHRFVLMKRFFTISGTVVLIRGITTLITSLDVPGTHLGCKIGLTATLDNLSRFSAAYEIWKGAGISFKGVRACGDYMFCGHTVAFTMLNFFITEYAPRDIYLIHTFAWTLNIFGIFFIISSHEHYSIDVFIAFYITSRLFMYYHTLANNHELMYRDLARARVWFPLFCFFESDTQGIVPNEYQTGAEITNNVVNFFKTSAKHYILLVYQSNMTTK